MLVLSRKKNQSIVIDGGIEIQILQLKGGTVKIGINAPNDVRIVRGELDMYSDMVAVDDDASEELAAANCKPPFNVTENRCEYFVGGPFAGKVLAK